MCLSSTKHCKNNVTFTYLLFNMIKNCTEPDALNESTSNEDIDYSEVPFINDIWIIVEPSEIILKTFAFLPIVLWGIFGNAALFYVIARNRHLRSPTNLLIANMAVADLLSLLIYPWVFLVDDFFQSYQFGAFGCKMEGAFECSLLLCSVMNLMAISYDRLTAIVLPQETRLSRKGAKIVMCTTWVAGIILSSPLYFYRTYKEREWLDFVEMYCTEDMIVTNIYWHVIITMMMWLPLIIMSICYVTIFVKLDRCEKSKPKTNRTFRVKYKAKVAKTIFIIILAFMVCRIPFTALIFYRNYLLQQQLIQPQHSVINLVNGTYYTLWFVSRYLIFANAGLNPVIYGLMNEKFRRVFKVTPVINWMFVSTITKPTKTVEEKKKTNHTFVVESKQHKIFTIFKPKAR